MAKHIAASFHELVKKSGRLEHVSIEGIHFELHPDNVDKVSP
jgi:hypothetical protein